MNFAESSRRQNTQADQDTDKNKEMNKRLVGLAVRSSGFRSP